MKTAAMNIPVQNFVWTYVFSSLGYIPRIGIARSHGNSVFTFLRNCQTVFHSGLTILHSCIAPASSSTLVIVHLFDLVILVGVKWYLTMGRFAFPSCPAAGQSLNAHFYLILVPPQPGEDGGQVFFTPAPVLCVHAHKIQSVRLRLEKPRVVVESEPYVAR